MRHFAGTVRRWENEILAYFTTGGASNGRTLQITLNLTIKQIKRVGRGFTNFDNYRLRLLLRCGVDWQDQPTARLREAITTLGGVEPLMLRPGRPSGPPVTPRQAPGPKVC